jgi:hypothetical protein
LRFGLVGLCPLAFVLALALPSPLWADETARRPDGRELPGAVTLAPGGRLRFEPKGKGDPLTGGDLALIHFDGADPGPWRIAGGLRVVLLDGQRLTGRLLGLDDEALTLRTAWAEKLTLSRAAVAAVVQPPGWLTVAEDDFQESRKGWKAVGKPVVGDGAAVLKEPGQELTFEPPALLRAGRVGVNFQERDAPAGARWLLEAHFQGGDRERVVRVTVAGGDGYSVDADGLDGTARTVARSAGPHRLTVQFTPRSLRVASDDVLLWYAEQGPGGSLRSVSLVCRAVDRGKPSGAVAWSEFGLARAVEDSPRPPGDLAQDEVWLTAGDQLFGDVRRADHRGVELEGRFGKRLLPWAEVRGCFLRRSAPPPQTATGEQVRLSFRSGLAADDDVLEGVLTGLDDRRLSLRHPLLGDLTLERGRVRRLWPLFHGRRLELDNGFHVLGGDRAPAGWPKSEGERWRGAAKLDAAPAEARLTVRLLNPPGGRGDGAKTEVIVNGRSVGWLEAEADGGFWTAALPRGVLHRGDNGIDLKRTPGRDGGPLGCVGVAAVALELSE